MPVSTMASLGEIQTRHRYFNLSTAKAWSTAEPPMGLPNLGTLMDEEPYSALSALTRVIGEDIWQDLLSKQLDRHRSR